SWGDRAVGWARRARRPHPEEARSAVSKDGGGLMLRDAALRAAPQHEAEEASSLGLLYSAWAWRAECAFAHPTTKQLRRLAQRAPLRRMHGLGRARLGRVVRRVLLAPQRLARELNEMMGDEPHAENGVDLPATQRVARRLPEWPAVIRQDSDVQHDAEGEHQPAREVAPVELAA